MIDDLDSGGFVGVQRHSLAQDRIRVVTWNIERGLQFPGILNFLRTADADLILLQEADLNARRTQHRHIARELARSLGLNYVFGREFVELGGGSGTTPALHGLATLSPWPLSHERILRFRRQSGFWRPRWYIPEYELFQRRLGGRITLVSEALVHNRRIITYNLHLESKGEDTLRNEQLRELLEDCRGYSDQCPVIIGGDFNLAATDEEAAAALRNAGFHDAVRLPWTATTNARTAVTRARCIDWIYTSQGFPQEGHVHIDVRASDHYPVSTVLTIPALPDLDAPF